MDTLGTAPSEAIASHPSKLGEWTMDAQSLARSRGVLVVDDDASIRLLLETVLRQRGFTVWTAHDGEEAVRLYRRHGQAITLVVLDVCMPILDGPQTVAVLRQWEPGLTFCFMTGESGDYSRQQLLALGAACIFDKPFCVFEVQERLEQLSQQAALSQSTSLTPQ
jgi:CheY-like chemotaxis protein